MVIHAGFFIAIRPLHLPNGGMQLPESDSASPAQSGIDYREELNEQQYAAVSAPDGPALVLAGAGSGKTRTLTYRVAWLLEKGVAPWNILLLTFTNKSAREMLERVEQLTGVPSRKFWGGTFHSIGQRILRSHGDHTGLDRNFTIMDQGDAESLLGQVIRDADKQFTKEKGNPKPRAILDLISYARNTQNQLDELVSDRFPFSSGLVEKVIEFYQAYRKRKKNSQLADYDDLLELWRDLLTDDAIADHYQQKFKYILVDEYQDTNQLQSEIVDRLAGHHRIMAVGDDAQCIYTWRGANLDNILKFADRHPDAKVYKIETNYRSTPEILNFANHALEAQPTSQGYHKHLHAVRQPAVKPHVVKLVDAGHQADFVIKRIHGLLREGYEAGDIGVLYRAHYQSMDLQMELSRQGIPYVITSGVRFFEQAHVRDLVAHLRFVNNTTDSVAFSRLMNLLPKIGPRTAENILKFAESRAKKTGEQVVDSLQDDQVLKKVPADAREDYDDLVITLQNLHEAMPPPYNRDSENSSTNASRTAQVELFGDDGASSPAETEPEHENIDSSKSPEELVEIAINGWYGDYLRNIYPENWEGRRDDLESLIAFASRYDDMSELLSELVLLNSESADRSPEVHQHSVRLMTIHQAKGLEYPAVFLIGAAQGLLPLKRAIESDNIEEERRLFYVAITRAMNELYISYPQISQMGGGVMKMDRSMFIEEIPEVTYEHLHVRRENH